ncbi:MAG: asparagine synthase (glutamine-hydrolyzing), partial [Acidobacteriota bacterium]
MFAAPARALGDCPVPLTELNMCGIIGILNLEQGPASDPAVLRSMLGMIRHRGPDEYGIYRDADVGLGNARLSIIDLSGGSQPISDEDGRYWIVFNGEIFNYLELRSELEARGHRFRTHTDTEVIVHLFEDHGAGCLDRLNGQFAIALWDSLEKRLFLARDRLGIRPLFYTVSGGRLVFASEIKSILAVPGITAELDRASLAQVFTFWSPVSPRTAFEGILSLPPAHYMLAGRGKREVRRYWDLEFAAEPVPPRDPRECAEELESLLVDASRIRLRADVPVGAYLSGGLDSSLTTAIVRRHFENRLETFSIAFENPDFDESEFQLQMADHLGTEHRVIHCS